MEREHWPFVWHKSPAEMLQMLADYGERMPTPAEILAEAQAELDLELEEEEEVADEG